MKRLLTLLFFFFSVALFGTTVSVSYSNGTVNHVQKGASAKLDTFMGIAQYLISPYQDRVKVNALALSPMEIYYHIPTQGNQTTLTDVSASAEALLMGPVFNHPNPFTLEDVDIEIKLFNIYGHKVWSKKYKAGQDEGAIGGRYNKIPFNQSILNGHALSAGIYFYLVLSEKSVLGKGKMAIQP